MPVIRRETLNQKPDWLKASAFGMFRVPKGGAVELHYHDADEIWFIVEGRARVVSEGREAELEGQKRRGHLHRQEHGLPVPQRRPVGQAAG